MHRGKDRSLKAVLSIVSAATFVFASLGCSSPQAATSGTTAPASTRSAETAPPVELTVQAAASLTDVLNEVISAYEAAHPGVTFTVNYDSSGNLQAQIEQGAPADLFISAAKKNMDALEDAGYLDEDTRKDVLGNSLVVIVPKGGAARVSSFTDLASGKIAVVAIGDPQSVPAGKYGWQALTAAGVAETIKPKTVMGKDVRAVLTYVETGDADAGIVYKTDALTSPKVRIAFGIDSSMHDPIVYPAAVIKSSAHAQEARSFVEYLCGPEALSVFEKFGFSRPPTVLSSGR